MNHPGEITPARPTGRPDLAIITNVGSRPHRVMGSRAAIAREKGALVVAVGPNGAVVLPGEDDFRGLSGFPCQGTGDQAGLTRGTVPASDLLVDTEGCRFVLHWEGDSLPARLPVPESTWCGNALLAVATGLEFGLSLEECAEGLSSARLSGGRLARRNVRGITILDDAATTRTPIRWKPPSGACNPSPLRGRRIAVLGRMGELGQHASAGYQQVGRAAASIDALIAVGPETVPLPETARAGGLKEIHETSSTEEAAGVLRRIAHEGDIVLVEEAAPPAWSASSKISTMLYYLYTLSEWAEKAGLDNEFFKALNVFKYLTFRSICAAATAFLISIMFGNWVIRKLISLKFGQADPQEGEEVNQLFELHGADFRRHADDGRRSSCIGSILISSLL